jgi:hypothetical protein
MHDTAPLFDALRRFVERGQAPFYSPRRHRPAPGTALPATRSVPRNRNFVS